MKPRPFLAPFAGALRSSRATAAWAKGTGWRRRCWGHPGRCGGRGPSVLLWGAAGLGVSRCWRVPVLYGGPALGIMAREDPSTGGAEGPDAGDGLWDVAGQEILMQVRSV